MRQLKLILGSSAATAALMLGLSVAPVAAQDCNGAANCNDVTTNVSDDSPTNNGGTQANNGGTAVTVSGDCSAAFVGDNENNASNGASTTGGNVGGNLGGALLGSNDQSNSQSNSQSTSASSSQSAGNSFSADCSTTNVTNVSSSSSSSSQVDAPRGGVHAGLGGAVKTSTSASALAGLTSSFAALGGGLRLLRKEQ